MIVTIDDDVNQLNRLQLSAAEGASRSEAGEGLRKAPRLPR
jgi:hypothetical protein